MRTGLIRHLAEETETLKKSGLFKDERIISTPQRAAVKVAGGAEVLNFCANNYLGLADDPRVVAAAGEALRRWGFGMSSVRFICGTQSIHRELEERIADFLGTGDAILYGSCFDANGGFFETVLGPEDAVISDALNHASIIDGIRLSKARRYRYRNNDMADLEGRLKEAADARFRLVVTDGVFSMDGIIADLPGICDLAESHDAMVMVDDSHAVGFMGENGTGTPEACGVKGRVDILTGTLGKALGGASGGYTAGPAEIIAWLRQRSRPYLFSNTLAPVIAATSIAVLDLVASQPELRERLRSNCRYFREGLEGLGFTLVPGEHPIIPVMLGDARLAGSMADRLLDEGIYVVGFSFPVVPRGEARIRTQISAAHSRAHLDKGIAAFARAGRALGIIS